MHLIFLKRNIIISILASFQNKLLQEKCKIETPWHKSANLMLEVFKNQDRLDNDYHKT